MSDDPEKTFLSEKKSEVFCSQFKNENDLICFQKLSDWPKSYKSLCLHCSEKIEGTPFPAVKYHDPLTDKYWTFGYFCRPCCSLAHVRDEVKDARSTLWTQIVLKKYFGITNFVFAPPRRCLQKYGGTMTLDIFYGEDNKKHKFLSTHSFPFVTFSMYAEVQQTDGLRGLRRPTSRTDPPQEQEQTEKTPLILEYLADIGSTQKAEVKKKKKAPATTGNLLSYIVK